MAPDAQTLNPNPDDYSLLTDLYQLTMIACYCGEGIENYPASFELNTINYQTLAATKSARILDVVGGDAILLEFGTRRAFNPQAAMWAAIAALTAGLDSTSNVATVLKLGIKSSGTMAHSFIMAVGALEGGENEAFGIFHRYFPNAPLLIDTYDKIEAAKRLSEQSQAGKIEVSGVRIDSGDLVTLSQKVRLFLPDSRLFASGDLDEWEITRLIELGACFDDYGLGTRLVTGTLVNGVYKIVEIKGIPMMKKSTEKITYLGYKQIFRSQDDLQIYSDRLGLAEESPNYQESPLLELVMKQGETIQQPESLTTIQQRTRLNVTKLPPSTRPITEPNSLSLSLSSALENLIHTSLVFFENYA